MSGGETLEHHRGGSMREIRYCLDCSNVAEITVHGRCSRCNSDAVAIPMRLQEYFAFKDKAIDELERIYQLPAESGGRVR